MTERNTWNGHQNGPSMQAYIPAKRLDRNKV